MVTLITEQLRKQSLEEPYHKAFSFNVNVSLPAVGSSPTVSWSASRSTQETSSATHPSSSACLEVTCGHNSPWPPSLSGEPLQGPVVSFTDEALQSSPPPPPPKRHCRSLSVPEDLSRCRSTWHPSASKVWTPVIRGCHSGGASSSGSGASSLPLCGPSPSFTSSSIHSSSSPTFFSLALSSDSPLSWGFPWDPYDTLKGACSASFATPSSCSSSPAPLVSHSLLQRRFSLSPVHIHNAPVAHLPPQPSHAPALTYGCAGLEHPALSQSPTSACSTPTSSRRDLHPALPRCHSQPCDMRKPRLKRRHDPDVLPCPRPGLDFSKMTQIGNIETLVCGTRSSVPASCQADQRSAFSPADFLGRSSIGPLSESEEEEEEEEERNRTVLDGGQKIVFERDCTELDLNLIEEN
ncbi:protein FAM53C-like [Mugil cephalus]|uniref:protein FAM53C-like n=1 Tax=Mugil cephalus TaxID=48193 RepID=UPI001FB6344A|nr:protein FAM53C-like [Mugil cephalus]XP_047440778.1 protein FAM53C-like [Mugil cephalus]